MVETVEKCKKRVCKWDQVIFYLALPPLQCAYLKFKSEHKKLSMSRCAFYVLKHYYSTTLLRWIRKKIRCGMSYIYAADWMKYYSQPWFKEEDYPAL